MPKLSRLLETSLYVADVGRSVDFYKTVFGFAALQRDDRFCALELPGRQTLLLFRAGATLQPIRLPGGDVPPHDGSGRLHIAFAMEESELPAWEEHLKALGIPIESRVRWPRGGASLYFRDPDGHLLELGTPDLWWREPA